ncbi:MAG: pilus assembly protein PilX [Gammaproteobacteria bacterium]|nr:pilus assembly protein PilX [Gammaproteobacteria bacterium]
MKIDCKRQRGAVMITALMILLLMTIFGISTMDTNILEEKMAGNMRDRNTAFQAAESALRAAETWIAAQTSMPDVRDISNSSDTSPLWELTSPDAQYPNITNSTPWWDERDASWWASKGVVLSGSNLLPGVAAQPAYIIEKLPPSTESLEAAQSLDTSDIYLQVTARGVGGTASTVVVLQSVYKW